MTTLEDYARYFNCVEGNTTLYALPKPEVVQRWRAMTHDEFRFCFKFPATISHQASLRQCGDLCTGSSPCSTRWQTASVNTGCNYLQPFHRQTCLHFGRFWTPFRNSFVMAWR